MLLSYNLSYRGKLQRSFISQKLTLHRKKTCKTKYIIYELVMTPIKMGEGEKACIAGMLGDGLGVISEQRPGEMKNQDRWARGRKTLLPRKQGKGLIRPEGITGS